ncbi:MAG: TIGR02680 family protein [Microthrixaceae bacterium]
MTEPLHDQADTDAAEVGRWRPARAGIRNIWEYDDQVFSFADGRLILRGPNGSGKSNALALLFPFLMEGVMSADAMDPFAGGRSMRTLLLGVLRDDDAGSRRFRHEQRLGYVWMEFESNDTSTDAETTHFTIGCGARATSTSTNTSSWFFATEQRVGLDFDLAPGGAPLSRGGLIDELGNAAVFDTAEAYRAAVDRALLGLGSERQQKLTTLIRVLRRPQLAGKLDLRLLSEVLSGGLPALDDQVLDDVAQSLDDLEATQRDLADLKATRAIVEAFVPTYVAYLTGEALGRSAAVIEAAQVLRRAKREVTETEAEATRLEDAVADNETERRDVALARSTADGRRTAVLESPAYRDASSLAEVERSVTRALEVEAKAGAQRDAAAQRADAAQQAASAATERAAEALTAAESALTEVEDLADAADVPWTLTRDEARNPERLESGARVAERSRREDLTAVRGALAQRNDAVRDHSRTEEAASQALRSADEAEAVAAEAAATSQRARADLGEAVAAWVAGEPWLPEAADVPTEPEIDRVLVAAGLADAVDTLGHSGAPSLAAAFSEATDPVRVELIERRSAGRAHLAAVQAEVASLQTQRAEVASEVDPGPAPPTWRTEREPGRPGAPLWRCCDWAPELDDHDRARLEAALDAAGLLDAWVAPDGDESAHSVPAESADSWLTAPSAPQSESGTATPGKAAGLATVLVPSVPEGSGLSESGVARVLASINLSDDGVGVTSEGRFALGLLRGRAAKPQPEYVGATARAERRRRRLAELDALIGAAQQAVDAATSILDGLDVALAALAAAPSTLPSEEALLRSVDAERNTRSQAEARREVAAQAAEAEAIAAQTAAAAEATLQATAHRHRLIGDASSLDRVANLLDRYAGAVRTAIAGRRTAEMEAERAERERSRAGDATQMLNLAERDLAASAEEHATLASRASTLRERLGEDAEAPLEALKRAEVELASIEVRSQELMESLGRLQNSLGRAREAADQARAAVARHEATLGERTERLPALRRRDVLALLVPARFPPGALPEGDDAVGDDAAAGDAVPGANDFDEDVPGASEQEVEPLPVDAVEFARWINDRLDGPPPTPEQRERNVADLDRAQKKVLDELHHGYDAAFPHDDDLVTVEINSDGGIVSLADLSAELARQDAALQSYLTEGDREVFERFLLNQVSHQLRRLLTDADEFVAGVNEALAGVRTTSRLGVHLGWELNTDDPGIRQAVRLLRHDTEQMGEEERQALRAFFERVIRTQRAEDPTAGYRAALEKALDYRSWHEFRPYLRTADNKRVQLTRNQYRQLSGGEQAMALHQPLFAAAAAHYDRAEPTAPRMIALDEAFAGIDEEMRGKLMGLTVAFDLDVILTGHELWGAYGEVPSVAVLDLLRRPPAEGVSVVSYRWDGHELIGDDDLAGTAAGSVPQPTPSEGLFAPEDP